MTVVTDHYRKRTRLFFDISPLVSKARSVLPSQTAAVVNTASPSSNILLHCSRTCLRPSSLRLSHLMYHTSAKLACDANSISKFRHIYFLYSPKEFTLLCKSKSASASVRAKATMIAQDHEFPHVILHPNERKQHCILNLITV